MDEYLKPNSSFIRLLDEHKKYGTLCIAYDFDNTVYDFHRKGESYLMVIELIRQLNVMGYYLMVFTANEDIEFVKSFLDNNNVPYHGINCNPPFFKSNSVKPYYNALLDDRAGLIQVYQELKLLITIINQKER